MNYEILSHPDRLLEEHVAQMQQFAEILMDHFQYNFSQAPFNRQIVNNIIELHDTGKSSLYFQYYIRERTHSQADCTQSECKICLFLNNHRNIKKDLDHEPALKNHALIGALLALSEEPDLIKIIYHFIIKSHHGSLPDFSHEYITRLGEDSSKLDLLNKIATRLQPAYEHKLKAIGEILKNKPRRISKPLLALANSNSSLEFYFYTLTLFSILLSSDKGSLMYPTVADFYVQKELSALLTKENWIDSYRCELISSQPSSFLNTLRNQAWQAAVDNLKNNLSNNIFSLNLPTGLGKTLINIKLAQLLIKEKNLKNFKIIYCLPYTSIIDQTATVIENALKHAGYNTKLLLVDHHLAQIKTVDYPEYPDDNRGYIDSTSEFILNSWENSIVLTTFVQLWDSIFNNSGKKLLKFNNLSHSVIILDEIQNIPPQFHKALEASLLEMTHLFNTHFIISTATHPVLFVDEAALLHTYNNDENYFFKQLNRIKLKKYKVDNELKISIEELANAIVARNKEGKSQLVILNTIRQSVELYRFLIQNFNLSTSFVLHLSSQHIPLLRRWKIRQLKNILKQHRRKKGFPPLLISTQVVEAGVDLDFDIVWREFAPIDSINQAAGRCNRNGLSDIHGEVLLFRLKDSIPSKVYDNIMLSKSETVLESYFGKSEIIDESSFFEINNAYFHEIKRAIADNSNKADEMVLLMKQLKFESISANQFRLIDEQPKYNVFLPVNKHARSLWKQYLEFLGMDLNFDTRRAIKNLIPQLLNYTVAVYKNQYTPQPNHEGHFLIYEESIGTYYNFETGFTKSENIIVL